MVEEIQKQENPNNMTLPIPASADVSLSNSIKTLNASETPAKKLSNPTVTLHYMSAFGRLEFRFDQDMIIPKNFSQVINETVLDVRILTPDFSLRGRTLNALFDTFRNVNFTWNVSDYRNRTMHL